MEKRLQSLYIKLLNVPNIPSAEEKLLMAVFFQAISDARQQGPLAQEARFWLSWWGFDWIRMMNPNLERQQYARAIAYFGIVLPDETIRELAYNVADQSEALLISLKDQSKQLAQEADANRDEHERIVLLELAAVTVQAIADQNLPMCVDQVSHALVKAISTTHKFTKNKSKIITKTLGDLRNPKSS